MISDFQKPCHSINCKGKLVDLNKPKIMGILNLTPDSFSDGGQFFDEKSALKQVEKMVSEGADFIDIGAQSTRPKAEFLSAETEIERLGNIISTIKKEFPEVLISLDTFYSEVVKFGFDQGIDLVNDISAGQFDPQLLETVGNLKLPYILMHNHSEYSKMHEKIEHEDLVLTLNYFFSEKLLELEYHGITDYILDPGFGFGKTAEQQFQLIDELEYLNFGKNPLLIGISRKSFIYKPLNKSPLEINDETQKLHLKCLKKGAKILRVHDVAEAKKTIGFFETNLN
ncbi:dihydropteroate synthase [Halpernia frigidisoli]|uniref:Dihydropteroate synthase n=1 Tax=Halpernia frigidisoli TaxID=1125876 RepID=A0A1I3D2L6_9FLAO|nr:dihydropteroate synthase [Halpernia frigidisoli]SFH80741.1 dihydropteroate synthase [Halpernia frigidisoli]